MVVIAGLFGAISGMTGAVISAMGPQIPTGPVVVLTLTFLVVLSLGLGARRGLVWRWFRARRQRMQVRTENVLAALYEMWEEHGHQLHGHRPEVIRMAMAVPGSVTHALDILRTQGLAQQMPDGGWALTTKGIKVAQEILSPDAGI